MEKKLKKKSQNEKVDSVEEIRSEKGRKTDSYKTMQKWRIGKKINTKNNSSETH